MANLSDFSQGVLMLAIILYVFAFGYAIYHDWVKNKEILIKNQNTDTYHRQSNKDFKDIESIITGIIEKRDQEKSMFRKMINSGKTGFFLGGLSGAITGGPAGALATGVVFGLINPIVIVLNDVVHVPDELTSVRMNREKDECRKKLGHLPHLLP